MHNLAIDMVQDKVTVSGPVDGSEPIPGFNAGTSKMCITRLTSTISISGENTVLWDFPVKLNEKTEIGFASSDDVEWIVDPSFAPQGELNQYRPQGLVIDLVAVYFVVHFAHKCTYYSPPTLFDKDLRH